ncbi:MAG: YraN family protein [Bacteroidales bacterium]|nr:YraN family protein [Bacteroidales bacterium]
MKTSKQLVGDRGEQEACNFLLGEGHRILRRNWRSGHLELDIVSVCGRTLHIVEVKTRAAGAPVRPEFNVDRDKRLRMVRAAGELLHSPLDQPVPPFDEVQFDVLSVEFCEDGPNIEYYPSAFVPVYTGGSVNFR